MMVISVVIVKALVRIWCAFIDRHSLYFTGRSSLGKMKTQNRNRAFSFKFSSPGDRLTIIINYNYPGKVTISAQYLRRRGRLANLAKTILLDTRSATKIVEFPEVRCVHNKNEEDSIGNRLSNTHIYVNVIIYLTAIRGQIFHLILYICILLPSPHSNQWIRALCGLSSTFHYSECVVHCYRCDMPPIKNTYEPR